MVLLCYCDCSVDQVSSCVDQLTERSLPVCSDCGLGFSHRHSQEWHCRCRAKRLYAGLSLRRISLDDAPVVSEKCSNSSREKQVAAAEYASETENVSQNTSVLPCQAEAEIPESTGAIIPSTQPGAAIETEALALPCQTVVNVDESVPANAAFTCPECGFLGKHQHSLQRHCLHRHHAKWLGEGLPLEQISLDDVPAAANAKFTCPECGYVGKRRPVLRQHCLRAHHAKWLGPGLPLQQTTLDDDVPAESEICSSQEKLVADAEYLSESQNKSPDASALQCQTEAEILESIDAITASSQPDTAVSCSPATNGYQQCFM